VSPHVKYLADEDATVDWGRWIGQHLSPGDVVILSGDLGAGKTTLTRGIGEALGVRGPVSSPTFVIAREHPPLAGGATLLHVDAYRLTSSADVDDLDLPIDDCITIVEWGRDRAEHLAASRLTITLVPRDTGRQASIEGVGPRWTDAHIGALAAGP